MNKITKYLLLMLVFLSFKINAQTYSTGTITLSNDMNLEILAKIDISATEVTLTLQGPSDRWFAIGFGGSSMGVVTDAFISEGSANYDFTIIPYDTPTADANQDWNVISDVVTGIKRDIVATRALDTGESSDYVFLFQEYAIPVIWARGNGATNTLAYHGTNKGSMSMTTQVLGVSELQTLKFSLYPNPVKDKLNIVLSSETNNATVTIYNVLGNKVMNKSLNNVFNKIDISNLSSGIYLVKVVDGKDTYGIKRFVKK